jgi:hypothetical protein
VIRGVSGRRPPKGEHGLRPLLAVGRPSAGTILGVSRVGARVAGHVMGLYEPSGVIRRRIGALLDDDRETGWVRPPEVGWLPYSGGVSGSLRSHPQNSVGDMVSRCGAQRYLGWKGSPSDSGDGVFGIGGLCMSTSRGLAALGSTSSMTWSRGSTV